MKPSSNKNTSVFLHGHIDHSKWKRVKLGDLGYTYNGLGGKTKHDFDTGDAFYIPFLNVLENTEIDINNMGTVNVSALEKQTCVQKNDLFFNTSSETPEEVGMCAYLSHELGNTFLNSFCFGFRLYNIHVAEPRFLVYLFNSAYGRRIISSLAQGVTRYNLSKEKLLRSEIHLPPITEQRRIANCINIVEKNLVATKTLISKYEAIKKATVNLLLEPRPGWEKVKFSDVCSSFEYGVGAPAMSFDGRNKYIRITDIDDTSHEFKPTPLSSPTFFDNNHVVRDGDILFARTGASVGKSYLYCPTDGKLIFAGFLIRASICTNVVDPKFIFLQTLTAGYRQWVSEESMRSGQPGLNINQYKDFELYLPELTEQRKIAAQISAIDNVLKDCHKQLVKAQSLKQGMMSYFFG